MTKADPMSSALEALSRLLVDPAPRVLHGSKSSPGVFAGAGQKEKSAARHCIDQGWLEATGEYVGKGKTRKEKYRITAQGVQAALSQAEATHLLRSLVTGLEGLQQRVAELEGVLSRSLKEVLDQIGPVKEGLVPFRQAVSQLESRLRPPDLDAIFRQMAPAPAQPAGPRLEWLDDVPRLLQRQRAQNPFQRLTLPQLLAELRKQNPSLSLGAFHEGLRQLHEKGRIRLGPYTQALPTLDDPRNALYLDREVKYYVEPA